MDAKDFLRIMHNECKRHNECHDCPFRGCVCRMENFVYYREDCFEDLMDKMIEVAEKLNHVKTYADDFFEKFPNAQKEAGGEPRSCRNFVYGTEYAYCKVSSECCHNCWNEPFPEKEDK